MGDIRTDLWQSEDILRIETESGSEDVHYPVFYSDLPEEYRIMAREKLNETEENREKCLKKLRAFMKKENLTCSEDLLTTVLRACKYNPRKAEPKLKKFLKSRRNVIEKLARVDEKKVELILEDTVFSVLPYRDRLGRTVFVTKPTLRLDLYSMDEVEPVAMSLVLLLLSLPMSQVCGMSYIAENKCDSILIYYPIAKAFRSYIYYAMDLPVRAGRADVVNENFIVRIFLNAIRPILPEKLSKRVFLNGKTYSTLHKVYKADLLPADFEGNLGPIQNTIFKDKLLKYMEKLKEEGQSLKS